MALHGRKTEERVHVLINNNQTDENSKARKLGFLCLSSFVVLGFANLLNSGAVMAQDGNAPVYATPNNSAQNEIRLQQMETQIRELTGKVEEQVYEINSLKTQVKILEKIATQPSNNPTNNNLSSNSNNKIIDDEMPPQPSGKMGSKMDKPDNMNPLGLDLEAQEPTGMKTATVITGDTDATSSYEKAYAALKLGNYDEAQTGFDEFLASHGDHVLAANAKYWLGETYYVRGDFKKAARVFAEGFQAFPESAKSPDILLKLGMSLKGMGKDKDACVALAQLPVKFPVGYDDVLKKAEQERSKISCDA